MVLVENSLRPSRFLMVMACLVAIGDSLRRMSKVNNVLQKSNSAAAADLRDAGRAGGKEELAWEGGFRVRGSGFRGARRSGTSRRGTNGKQKQFSPSAPSAFRILFPDEPRT